MASPGLQHPVASLLSSLFARARCNNLTRRFLQLFSFLTCFLSHSLGHCTHSSPPPPPPHPSLSFNVFFWIDFLNVSALSVFNVEHINMHGIYTHNQDQRPGNAWILQGTGNLAGYHIHFLNEVDTSRTTDYRYIFMPKVPQLEQHMGSFIRRALSKRIEEKKRGKGKGNLPPP